MTITRRLISQLFIGIFAITILFPPFIVQLHNHNIGCGYGFLLSWPTSSIDNRITCRVDVAFLLTQWLFIASIGGGLIYLLKDEVNFINLHIPINRISSIFGHMLLVIIFSFILGVISKRYSIEQVFFLLTENHLLMAHTASMGLGIFPFGYVIAAIWAWVRKKLLRKESSLTSKITLGFFISLLITIPSPNV